MIMKALAGILFSARSHFNLKAPSHAECMGRVNVHYMHVSTRTRVKGATSILLNASFNIPYACYTHTNGSYSTTRREMSGIAIVW